MEHHTVYTTIEDLKQAIHQKEKQQKELALLLKQQLNVAYNSIKPVNLIKNSIKEIVDAPEIRGHLINSSIGLAAGFMAKQMFVNKNSSPLRKLLGTLVMVGVTNLVSRHADPLGHLTKAFLDSTHTAEDNSHQLKTPS